VPGIVRWPGRIEPGTVTDTPAGVVDLLPTFCEAAGVAPDGKPVDGTSLLPLFGGEPLARAKPLYWFYSPSHPVAVLRDGDWCLTGALCLMNSRSQSGKSLRKTGIEDHPQSHRNNEPVGHPSRVTSPRLPPVAKEKLPEMERQRDQRSNQQHGSGNAHHTSPADRSAWNPCHQESRGESQRAGSFCS
jgi:arylsulfatase A-like enzyme